MFNIFEKIMSYFISDETAPPKLRKRPKLYEVPAYSYFNHKGKEVHVKAHVKGGK